MNSLYWASVIAALGWIYAALASAWPKLFHKDIIENAKQELAGYRLGWMVYWRLPLRAAVLIAILSALPILAAVFLKGWLGTLILSLMASAAIAAWIFAPPGNRLTYARADMRRATAVFELQSMRDLRRAFAVLVVFGLVPALVIGALVYSLLAGLLGRTA